MHDLPGARITSTNAAAWQSSYFVCITVLCSLVSDSTAHLHTTKEVNVAPATCSDDGEDIRQACALPCTYGDTVVSSTCCQALLLDNQ